jgi:hypothetical protein
MLTSLLLARPPRALANPCNSEAQVKPRWLTVFLTLLASILFLGASATAQSANLTLNADIGGETNQTATFYGFNNEGQTTGSYDDGRGDQDDWTWVRNGDDINVHNKDGDLVCIYRGAANAVNPEGPIEDQPGNGNHGGHWERP